MTSHDSQSYPQHGRTISKKSFSEKTTVCHHNIYENKIEYVIGIDTSNAVSCSGKTG